MGLRVSRFCVLGVVALCGFWRASGQTTAGLNGVVTDASGAVVQGARVSVNNVDTGIRREAVTNESGLYEFPLLQPGTYSLTAQKEGFKQTTQSGIRLEVNQVARIDLTMQLGAVSESVEVQAAAPLLESNTSAVGQVVESKAVSDLPLNGRNFAQLAILSPGRDRRRLRARRHHRQRLASRRHAARRRADGERQS